MDSDAGSIVLCSGRGFDRFLTERRVLLVHDKRRT